MLSDISHCNILDFITPYIIMHEMLEHINISQEAHFDGFA